MEALARVRETAWHRRHVLVQELVPPQGYDLCVLVAAERVVGAVYRVAAEGEGVPTLRWEARRPVIEPPLEAFALAVAAARATGIALVGVDLLPDPYGGWTVVELNGPSSSRPSTPRGRRLRRGRARARSGCATGVVGGVLGAGSGLTITSLQPSYATTSPLAIGQAPSDVFEIALARSAPPTKRHPEPSSSGALLHFARGGSSVG